jgi:hypothetical protein
MIRYDPRLAVFHYRRRLWPDHAWQIANVGRSRGCFIRAGEARSLRPVFALPFAFCLGALGLIAVPLLLGAPLYALVLPASAYIALGVFGHPGKLPLLVRLVVPAALLVQHAAYTWGLCAGLVSGRRTTRERNVTSAQAPKAAP